MTFPKTIVLALAGIILIVTPTSTNSAKPRVARIKTVEVKVGITEYSKIQRTYQNYERLFRELAASSNSTDAVLFRFAVGTYGEVRDWYNKGMIDVAILSAMPVGELLLAGDDTNLEKAYIGDLSVSAPPNTQSVLSLFSDRKHDPFYYQAGCLFLRSDKELLTIADSSNPLPELKKLWDAGTLRFLFVRPYSLSGYIAPVRMLKEHGIDPLLKPKQMQFTYEHSESLNRLINPKSDPEEGSMHQVAFVLDDSRYPGDTPINIEQTFGRIKLASLGDDKNPSLDDYNIPREIVLANYNQQRVDVVGDQNKFTRTKALMDTLFGNWVAKVEHGAFTRSSADPILRFRSRTGWQKDFEQVQQLLDGFSLPKQLLYKSTLDDLLTDLINTKEPRLALVLSGGGAKCAYQAGAIVEIENQLKIKLANKIEDLKKLSQKKEEVLKKQLSKAAFERERKKMSDELDLESKTLSDKLDIDLVVGTSGGAINALLVGMRLTQNDGASGALSEAWKSFKQEQFLRPSFRFGAWFGLCFGVFQALLITLIVLLFGRQAMNWPATIIVIVVLAGLQLIPAAYFQFRPETIWLLLKVELITVVIIIGLVLLFTLVIRFVERVLLYFRDDPAKRPLDQSLSIKTDKELDPHHWRKLTILLLAFFGVCESLIALIPKLQDLGERLPDTHLFGHGWTAIILISNWSFPFPLTIAIMMFLLGWRTNRGLRWFDWLKWRGRAIAWTAVILVLITGLLLGEAFFRGSHLSKVDGIEEAFAEEVPKLIKETVDANFAYSHSANAQENLQLLSKQIMANHLLKRDLVITTSKLPVSETNVSLPVNSLPDDLYFYYRSNEDVNLKPPLDKRFIPFKYNEDKLIDVVIGSSTIYPIFPSRTLQNIYTGNEEERLQKIDMMRIVDGGFIHNIPIDAAKSWWASHIIVIEASPAPPQRDPHVFWDHMLNAFGYLFSQAQKTDTLGPATEVFLLRPTSACEKSNIRSVCTENDGAPVPDMDTFDFTQRAANKAFESGKDDVKSPNPLFVRIPGTPNFQNITSSTTRN